MYFLDTFAVIEYLNGNPSYKLYFEKDFCLSRFNLMELYYASLRDRGQDAAEADYETFASAEVEIPEKTLKQAMIKKFEMQKKKINFSYVDAIGYQYALDNSMKFVTGDQAFKNLDPENVIYLGK